MKKVLLSIAMMAFIFTGCNNNKKAENTVDHSSHQEVEAASTEDHDDHHLSGDGLDNVWTTEIEKNDGAKWDANPETNEGVKKMQNLLKSQPTKTLEDYYALAEQLNTGKNYVVKNCTMKGASHDNLHVWLLPLMAKIEALSETKSLDEASKLKHSIEENVNLYSDYFK